MKLQILNILFLYLLLPLSSKIQSSPLIIAHRGASAYLPEHTLEAKALAYGMGADYLEQDLVLSRDNRVIVMHDIHLDQITNVSEIFPERHRADGRFYAIDFDWSELQQLKVLERFETPTGNPPRAVFPNRFPLGQSRFHLHTLEEEIEMIQGLNHATGKSIGIYPEIKQPEFHLAEGKDLSREVLTILKSKNYTCPSSPVYLQCFSAVELLRIHHTLEPELGIQLKKVQLLSKSSYRMFQGLSDLPKKLDADWLQSDAAMNFIATYAQGLGPDYSMLLTSVPGSKTATFTPFISNAHRHHLVVHPYTFRADSGLLPAYAPTFHELLELMMNQGGIDGFFTDFPDKAYWYLNRISP